MTEAQNCSAAQEVRHYEETHKTTVTLIVHDFLVLTKSASSLCNGMTSATVMNSDHSPQCCYCAKSPHKAGFPVLTHKFMEDIESIKHVNGHPLEICWHWCCYSAIPFWKPVDLILRS